MKLANMIIKLLSALSALVEIAANLYHTIRDFIVSAVKEIKNHFGSSSKNKNG